MIHISVSMSYYELRKSKKKKNPPIVDSSLPIFIEPNEKLVLNEYGPK